jgi:hypothetical protein
MAGLNPFEVLGISVDAEPEVVAAAYRALARKYHPDVMHDEPPAKVTERMVQLNWAKSELDRDLPGWRRRVKVENTGPAPKGPRSNRSRTGARPTPRPSSPEAVVPQQVQLSVPVIILAGQPGSTATFEAWIPGISPQQVKARFPHGGWTLVERLQPSGDHAVFKVTVVEECTTDLADNVVETIELRSAGHISAKLFVSLTPVRAEILNQRYSQERIAPARFVSPESRISFGKHKGRSFRSIAGEEPGYLDWMLREGAGTHTERECARSALDLLRGAPVPLPSDSRRPAKQIGGRDPRKPSELTANEPTKALPDPNRPGGMLAPLKALVRWKR